MSEPLVIELTAVDHVSPVIQKIRSQLNGLGGVAGSPASMAAGGMLSPAALNATATAMATLGRNASMAIPPIIQAGNSLVPVAGGAATATTSLAGLSAAVGAVVLAFGAFSIIGDIARSVWQAFTGVIREGVDFNSTIETGRIGLAALIMTFREVGDGAAGYLRALGVATGMQNQLRLSAFQTIATYKQLESGLEQLYAAAGTQKATSQEIIRLNTTVANLAAATHTPYETAYRQISLALLGVARTTGRLGAFLRELGISNETLRSWQQQGIAVQQMLKHLEAFEKTGGMLNKTFAGVTSNVKDIYEQMSGVVAGPLMEAIKEAGSEFVNLFVDFSGKIPQYRDETIAYFRAIGAAVGGVFEVIIDTTKRVFGIVTGTIHESGTSWMDIIKTVSVSLVVGFSMIEKAAILVATGIRTVVEMVGNLKTEVDSLFGRGTFLSTLLSLLRVIPGVGSAIDAGFATAATLGPRSVPDGLPPGMASSHDTSGLAVASHKTRESVKSLDQQFAEIDATTARLTGTILGASDAVAQVGDKAETTNPKVKGLTDEMKKANKAYGEWVDKTLAGLSDVGLDGFVKKFAKAAEDYQRIIDENDRRFGELKGPTAEETEKHTGLNLAAWERYSASFAILWNDMLSGQENAYAATMDKITRHGMGSAEARLESERATAEVAIANYEKVAQSVAYTQALMTGDWGAYFANIIKLQNDAAKMREQSEAHLALKERVLLAERTRDWKTYFDTQVKLAVMAGQNIPEATQKWLKDTAQKSYASAVTMADDVSSAFWTIRAEAKTTGQIVSDYLVSAWQTVAKSFEDTVYNVISGKFSSLKDVLASLGDDMLRNFSKMVTEMVKKWIVGQQQMVAEEKAARAAGYGTDGGYYKQTGPNEATFTESGQGQVGNYAGAVMSGVGYGAMVGGMSGAPGFSTGAMVGAITAVVIDTIWTGVLSGIVSGAIGGSATANPLVMIIGAIIGGLIAVLSSPNTEGHFPVTGTSLNIAHGGSRDTPTRMMFDNLEQTRSGITGYISDLFRSAGGEDAAEFTKLVDEKLKEYLLNMNFEVHAGSMEDIQKDLEYLLSGIIPKEMMHTLFGQTPSGGRDVPGISGASSYDMSAVDASGPVTQFLLGLGFTVDRVQQIADRIDTTDPEKFMEWLGALVGIVVGVRDLIAAQSKSLEEIYVDIDAQKAMTLSDAFQKSASNLIQMAEDLSLYTGDEQVKRGQALLAAAQQRYDAEMQAIAAIKQLAESIGEAFRDIQDRMFQAFDTPEIAEERMRNAIYGTPYVTNVPGASVAGFQVRVGEAMTPEEIQQIAAEAAQAIGSLFDLLFQRLQAAKSLLASFRELGGLFGQDPVGLAATAFAPGGLRGFIAGVTQLQEQVAAAAQLSGDAQITALQEVQQAAAQRYQEELDLIRTIEQNIQDLHTSFAQQKWDIQYGEMDPGQKAAALIAEMQRQEALIAGATDPAQIQAATSRIQQLISQYLALFSADDPNRGAAVTQVLGILDHIEEVARAAYAQMNQSILDAAQGYQNIMNAAGKLLEGTISATQDEITQLNIYLSQLSELIDTRLRGMVQAILDTNVELNKVMADAVTNFTALNEVLMDPFEGDAGFNGIIKNATDSVEDFGGALDRLTGWINNRTGGGGGIISGGGATPIEGGGGTTGGGDEPPPTAPRPTGARSAIAMLRRTPQIAYARTGY